MADPFASRPEPEVLVADDSLIVVRKPNRMHSAPGLSSGSLCSWVFARFPEVALAGRERGRATAEGGLLHRLDYETSGLVLFARNPEALAFLLREQEEGRFVKEYLLFASLSRSPNPAGSRPPRSYPAGLDAAGWESAIAAGDVEAVVELLRAGVGARITSSFKPFGPGAARVACLGPVDGKAGTELAGVKSMPETAEAPAPARLYSTSILETLALKDRVELRVALDRGFRHQVRAHAAWVGLPILGDPLYGGSAAGRLYLHSSKLRFTHPSTGLCMTLSSE